MNRTEAERRIETARHTVEKRDAMVDYFLRDVPAGSDEVVRRPLTDDEMNLFHLAYAGRDSTWFGGIHGMSRGARAGEWRYSTDTNEFTYMPWLPDSEKYAWRTGDVTVQREERQP